MAKKDKKEEIPSWIKDLYKGDLDRVVRGERPMYFRGMDDSPLRNVSPEFDILSGGAAVKGMNGIRGTLSPLNNGMGNYNFSLRGINKKIGEQVDEAGLYLPEKLRPVYRTVVDAMSSSKDKGLGHITQPLANAPYPADERRNRRLDGEYPVGYVDAIDGIWPMEKYGLWGEKMDKKQGGGYVASRDNTSIGSSGINLNTEYGKKINDGVDITEIIAGGIPIIGDVMDVRDFVESSKAGDGLGMTLSALGLFPVLGEFFSFANKVKKIPLPEDKRKLYDFLVDNDLVDKYVHDEPLVRDFFNKDVHDRISRNYNNLPDSYKAAVDLMIDNGVDLQNINDVSNKHIKDKIDSMLDDNGKRLEEAYNLRVSADSDFDDFRYEVSSALDNSNAKGFYTSKYNKVVTRSDESLSNLSHEFRHKYDSSNNYNKIYLSENDKSLLKDAYRADPNSSSNEISEKIAFNTQARFRLWNKFYNTYGRTPSIDDLDKYIDSMDEIDVYNLVSGIGSNYAEDYSKNMFGATGKVLKESSDKIKKAIKNVPAILPAAIVGKMLMDDDKEKKDKGGAVSTGRAYGDGKYVIDPDRSEDNKMVVYDEIWDYLTDKKGIPQTQAIGILSNIAAESGGDTEALGVAGDFGIQQWLGPRKKELQRRYGKKPTLIQQLDYLVDEYQGKVPGLGWNYINQGKFFDKDAQGNEYNYYMYSKSDFDNAVNYKDATVAWNQGYGRPLGSTLRNEKRFEFADMFANRYGVPENEPMRYEFGQRDSGTGDGGQQPMPEKVVPADPSLASSPSMNSWWEKEGQDLLYKMLAQSGANKKAIEDIANNIKNDPQSEAQIAEAERIRREQAKRQLVLNMIPGLSLNIKGMSRSQN